LSYNSRGLVSSETVAIAGSSGYTSDYGYDAHLRPTTTTYPDGEVVTLHYNGMGLPNKLTSSVSGVLVNGVVSSGSVSDGVSYDELGRLLQLRFPAGGNLWRQQVYWPWCGGALSNGVCPSSQANSNRRLSEVRVGTAAGSNNRLYFLYGYDAYGNIGGMTEQYNAGSAQTFLFCYDAQQRLVRGYASYGAGVTCSNAASGQPYSYDVAGRLTNYEGATMVGVSGPPHARVPSGVSYAFDANGNFTLRPGGQSLAWDHENRLQSVVAGSFVETYIYDPDGQRIRKIANGTTTLYPFPHYEISGGVATRYYFFAGQRIAMRTGSTLTYLHADHLGGTALTTVGGGSGVIQGYRAYGRFRTGGSLPTDHRFTGQKLDASGLYYFNARYYDPELGTFIFPDTLVPDPTRLSDYNRRMAFPTNPTKHNIHWAVASPLHKKLIIKTERVQCSCIAPALLLGRSST
jgi:RHS repeat-associated protein